MAEQRRPIAQYAARTNDEKLRMVSTSGGVFTELARVALAKSGVVVGATWVNNPFRAALRIASDERELSTMRGAKYVWSGSVGKFDHVDSGGLFTGLPCQIAAARKVYGDKFIYCALICHSTPEPKVWDAYVRALERRFKSKLTDVSFRDKKHGDWRHGKFVAEFANGKRLIEKDNVFKNVYFMGLSTRLACTKCPYKCGRHGADLVIGDFWGIERTCPEWDDGKGINAVLSFTDRGDRFLHETSLELMPVTYGQILDDNPHLETNVVINHKRRRAFMSLYGFVGIRLASRIAMSRLVH